MDLFSLDGLFSQFKPRDDTLENPSFKYLSIRENMTE